MLEPEEQPGIKAEAERVLSLMRSRDFKGLRKLLKEEEIADVAEILEQLDIPSIVVLFRLVPKSRRADVFSYLPFERQEELLEELPDVVVTSVVNDMEPDDRTRLLEDLPFEIRSQIMLRLSPDERKMAWQLLSYPEDSVGRLMTPEFLVLKGSMKVGAAIEMLRWSPDYPEEQLHYLFVTDSEGRYLGDVSLASLVTADPPTTPVSEIMNTNAMAVNANEDQEAAVDFFRKYDRPYLPVVDQDGTLLGVVTADDVFDVAEDEATEDIHQFGGQSLLEDSYFQATLLTLFRKRAGWLAILFVGGILTSSALKHYQALTASMTWLVIFLPMIISSGGNSGSQAAALVIRGIAVREMDVSDWVRVLGREVLVGLMLGSMISVMGFAVSRLWDLDPIIGVIVGLSLCGVILFGAVTGAMLPFFFKRVNLDPAVSSSPLLASVVDIVGVLLFYNLARHIISYWESLG